MLLFDVRHGHVLSAVHTTVNYWVRSGHDSAIQLWSKGPVAVRNLAGQTIYANSKLATKGNLSNAYSAKIVGLRARDAPAAIEALTAFLSRAAGSGRLVGDDAQSSDPRFAGMTTTMHAINLKGEHSTIRYADKFGQEAPS